MWWQRLRRMSPLRLQAGKSLRVADVEHIEDRTVTADIAVEMREAKGAAVLLLVDTERAGAGMDGIYSAAQEVDEAALFRQAGRLAGSEITRRHSSASRRYARTGDQESTGGTGADTPCHYGPSSTFFVALLWVSGCPAGICICSACGPFMNPRTSESSNDLDTSRMLVDRLLGPARRQPPTGRSYPGHIRLDLDSERECGALERFLHSVDTKPLFVALESLAENEELWIGNLRPEPPAQSIQGIELNSWRNRKRGHR